MAKSLKTEKSQQGGNGVDPDKWVSNPAEAVGAVSNASIASMTGGDAGTYEGIVDYILMQEERDAPAEQEIIASEQAGLLERNYPEEVQTTATLEPHTPFNTGTGMETATPQLATSGGGLNMAGLASGDMGLDGLEEGVETSSASVGGSGVELGFGSGDVPTGLSGGMDGGMVVDHKADDAKVFKAIGGPDPTQLSSQNATVLAGMQGMADGLAGQIDSAVGGAMGSLAGAYSSNDSALDSAFGANWTLIQDSFATARATVDASAIDAKTRVEAKAGDALSEIRSGSQALLADGDALIDNAAATLVSQAASTESSALGAVNAAQSQASAIADKWAKEAKRVGDAKAAAYRGRGNGGTEGKRDEARAQVAEGYGAGYAEDLPNVGKEAVETLEKEKANIRSAIRELIRPLLENDLPMLRENLHAEVNAASEEARQAVESGRDSAFDSIEQQHTEAGEQLATAESAARTDLIDVYGAAKGDLADIDSSGQQSIQAMGEGIRGHLVEKVAQLRSLIAKNPALPLDTLQEEVASLSAELVKEAAQGSQAIQQTATDIASQEATFTQGAVEDMNSIGTSASEGALGIADQASTSFDSLATDFESGIDTLLDGFNSNLDQLRSQLNENVGAVLVSALNGLGTTLEGVKTGVADFLSGFDADLGKAVNEEMVSAIEAKAEEEAAKIKEPSFWDKVVSVVAVVLVVVAIVAITVVTAGVGAAVMGAIGGAVAAGSLSALAGVALTVVAGAAIGAVSSALQEIVMQIATKGFDPRKWDWKAIGIEALIGGVVGGLTAGLGEGIKALGRWGTRAVSATSAVRGPAMTRIASISASLIDDAGKLSKVGDIAKGIGGDILSAAATWAIKGERPDLGKVASGIVLNSVTSQWAGGMTDLLAGNEPEHMKAAFSAYMEFIAKESATGEKTESILEKLEAPVADLGNLELTTDYKPTWTPTW